MAGLSVDSMSGSVAGDWSRWIPQDTAQLLKRRIEVLEKELKKVKRETGQRLTKNELINMQINEVCTYVKQHFLIVEEQYKKRNAQLTEAPLWPVLSNFFIRNEHTPK